MPGPWSSTLFSALFPEEPSENRCASSCVARELLPATPQRKERFHDDSRPGSEPPSCRRQGNEENLHPQNLVQRRGFTEDDLQGFSPNRKSNVNMRFNSSPTARSAMRPMKPGGDYADIDNFKSDTDFANELQSFDARAALVAQQDREHHAARRISDLERELQAVQQQLSAYRQQATPRLQYFMSGDPMELLIAPGDILVVRGAHGTGGATGRIVQLGATGGFLGHVLIAIAAPRCISRKSEEGMALSSVWPGNLVQEIWSILTVESTRRETGLYETQSLIFVNDSRQMMLIGEVELSGDLCCCDHEPVELWQSPPELRAGLRIETMRQVLVEMKAETANWSATTAARAVLQSAKLGPKKTALETLEDLKSYWSRPPICTSVVIAFWQRYFAKVAASLVISSRQFEDITLQPCAIGSKVMYWSASFQNWIEGVVQEHNLGPDRKLVSYNLDVKKGACPENIRNAPEQLEVSEKAVDLMHRFMPLKADRALPGDLLKTLRECHWSSVTEVPFIFKPTIVFPPPLVAFHPAPQDVQHDVEIAATL